MRGLALTLGSERFAPTGGIEAQGARRLLGAPHLPLLHTLLRESGQNSCDAMLESHRLHFHVRLRHLTREEHRALNDAIGASLPPASESSRRIAEFLAKSAPTVLEICDFGTRGLGGPTRADRVTADDVSNDFVDFIRNIGVSRDVPHGGGTYGYGKSILYRASKCATVLVHSLTQDEGHRLIGCHLGDAISNHAAGRLTGRHWWGIPSSETSGLVEPVTGQDAVDLVSALGMPERCQGQSGTSIMILDPDLPEITLRECAGEVVEALLWFFWPRMVDGERGPRMVCDVEVDGESVEVPRPEQFPPLDLFVEAYRTIKSGEPSARKIRSERPKRHLGMMCLRTGLRNPRRYLVAEDRSILPSASAHIAAMRPVEIVVRYYEGLPFPNELQEWAGVFICDEDPEVEAAFAMAEPPAHDDWDTELMPKGHAKTYVNVALREIKKAAMSWAAPPPVRPITTGAQPSLARAAEMLGSLVPDGRRADRRTKRSGGQRRKSWQVRDPEFVKLREAVDGLEAIFRVRATNHSLQSIVLSARPGLVLDGVLSEERSAPNGDVVRIIAWQTPEGEVLASSSSLTLPPGADIDCQVRIEVPALSAVGLRMSVEEGDT